MRLIDVHHHFFPPAFAGDANVRRSFQSATFGAFASVLDRTVEHSLAEMDRHGVMAAVLSIPTPGVWFGDDAAARALARRCNEFGARLVAEHPHRFALLAVLPLPDVDGSLREIAHAFDVLHADGIGVLTSYENRWLGDPTFAPVLEELNRRRAVVFVHPTAPAFYGSENSTLPPSVLEFLFDTTRTIASLLYSGAAVRFPDITFIFCHAGGALVSLVHRIERLAHADDAILERLPRGARNELQRFHFDIATSAHAAEGLLQLVPVSRLLFGTDAPVLPMQATVDPLESSPLSSEHLAAVAHENALRLFPRLRPSAAASAPST